MSFVPLSKIPHFDPRSVPIIGRDTHLEAVPVQRMMPEALRERFASPPRWSPEVRAEPRFTDRTPAQAAVLVALVMREQPTLLLTQRTHSLSTHAGQIAFAGGKVDATDASATAAALREAKEEVGLAACHIEVLGELPSYVTGTAFDVTPVVAMVEPAFKLTLNPDEVADAFEVPLDFLMNPANHAQHALEWMGSRRVWFSMTWQDAETGQERFIWGATAGMLRNLYRFLVA